MGEAVARGLSRRGWTQAGLTVVETDADRRATLAGTAPPLEVEGSVRDVLGSAGASGRVDVIIAVKPHDVQAACGELLREGHGRVARILSIAAGVTIADLEGWSDGEVVVLRAMPNTPALVGAAASVVAAGSRAGAADVAWAREVLGSIGTVVELPEPALDAVTGLSGSGPAYVFLVAEALVDAGVLVGLSRPVARELAVQTLLGSARLLAETGEEAATLRAAVTSPGGTTASGLRVLEAAGLRAAFLDAVSAAAARARELGRPH